MPILILVQWVIPLFCRQNVLFLSLLARKFNKTGFKMFLKFQQSWTKQKGWGFPPGNLWGSKFHMENFSWSLFHNKRNFSNRLFQITSQTHRLFLCPISNSWQALFKDSTCSTCTLSAYCDSYHLEVDSSHPEGHTSEFSAMWYRVSKKEKRRVFSDPWNNSHCFYFQNLICFRLSTPKLKILIYWSLILVPC